MLADETDRHHHQILDASGAEILQGIVCVRPKPLHRTYPALVGQREGIGEAQITTKALHDQLGAGLDLFLVRIAGFLHIALRHPVGTKKHMGL